MSEVAPKYQFAEPRPSLSPTVPFRPFLNCVCGREVQSRPGVTEPVQPRSVAVGLHAPEEARRTHLSERLRRQVAEPSTSGPWTYRPQPWFPQETSCLPAKWLPLHVGLRGVSGQQESACIDRHEEGLLAEKPSRRCWRAPPTSSEAFGMAVVDDRARISSGWRPRALRRAPSV